MHENSEGSNQPKVVREDLTEIVHEFNNILTSLKGNAEFLSIVNAISKDHKEVLADILNDISRASEMVDKLHSITRS